jgi:plastocyanin
MNRRGFFASLLATGVAAPALAGDDHGKHGDAPRGSLASATVSFGSWAPFDRHPANNDRTQNVHTLVPNEVRVRAGGTVNFIISGFHQVLVYGPGTRPGDINSNMTTVVTNPPGPPLIDDPNNRVYRGIDPSTLPILRAPGVPTPLQDRIEVVNFPNPGRFLVACAVQPHFLEGMFGFVRVLRRDEDD